MNRRTNNVVESVREFAGKKQVKGKLDTRTGANRGSGYVSEVGR